MKNILISLFLLLSTLLFSDELSWVDQQVNAIKPPRSGMKYRDIKSIKNPFIFLKKNRTSEPKTTKSRSIQKVSKTTTKLVKKKIVHHTINKHLVLGAILNNSVMINGKWYKLGDKVNEYEISQINGNSVLLRKQKKQLVLSTKSTSNKLKFLNK